MAYSLIYDLHTHTSYSHGKGSILSNAQYANAKGLSMLGIADHGPGHRFYGIDMSEIANMRKDIREANSVYPNLDIKLGVEANIINLSGRLDIEKEEQKLFDYIIAGYHYGVLGEDKLRSVAMCIGGYVRVFSDRNYNTDVIINSIYENDIKILTHPDDKIDVDIDAIARACERTATLMEINNHHLSLHGDSIKIASKYDVKFVLSSDAHKPEAVGEFDKALKIALDAGLDPERIVNLWNS